MNRKPVAIVAARKAQPAPGLVVDRPFPGPEVDFVDPWLMLDHFGPDWVEPGDSGGLNPHPHRGFETVTLIFDGAMEHHDSSGGHGFGLRPSDQPASTWPQRCEDWMKQRGLLQSRAAVK